MVIVMHAPTVAVLAGIKLYLRYSNVLLNGSDAPVPYGSCMATVTVARVNVDCEGVSHARTSSWF